MKRELRYGYTIGREKSLAKAIEFGCTEIFKTKAAARRRMLAAAKENGPKPGVIVEILLTTTGAKS